ncbi:MAG TPA: cytochrome c [Candidatus Rubrimentiphilum sp.]|nr:cytochrome c [Candidatus Rubrimentiphilum sp.]
MPFRVLAFLTVVAAGSGLAACNRQTHSSTRAAAVQTDVPANVARGRSIYAVQCSACHGRDGTGGQIGPSLRNESARRNEAAVRAIVLNPEPPMPKLYPARLTQADVRDVSAFVETL